MRVFFRKPGQPFTKDGAWAAVIFAEEFARLEQKTDAQSGGWEIARTPQVTAMNFLRRLLALWTINRRLRGLGMNCDLKFGNGEFAELN